MKKAEADILFEVSWEVANKVGGIYTVVKSKVELMKDYYKNYYLIGPYFPENAKLETQQVIAPDKLKSIFDQLEQEGIVCYFAKWLVKGEPNIILINFQNILHKKDEIKTGLWTDYGIDSIRSRWDFEEPIVWSYAVSRLLKVASEKFHNQKIVGHFHEWLAGTALLHLKNTNIKTVFTTHATMLGRSIAGNNMDLYSMIDNIVPEEEARKLGVEDKYLTERACATEAHVFTTVSEITSIEAEKILGRSADVLLLNGLDIQRFPNFEECSIKHKQYRDQVREFLIYYFFPYYTFEIKDTLLLFIVGRYEFKNKGLDIFIKALGRLNERLKAEGSAKTVIAFFWIPSGVNGIRTELLESKDKYDQVKEFVEGVVPELRSRLIQNILQKHDVNKSEMFDKEFLQDAHKHTALFLRDGTPRLCTHYLFDEANDNIINGFRTEGLLNRKEDMVKVIFYPVYLNGNDNLLDLKYYDALQACHLGIFPSYYEPWGYTPLESAALGVPALTTDLAGFGRFIRQKKAELHKPDEGIFILDRFGQPEDSVVENFTDLLDKYVKLKQNDRVEQKMLAKDLAEYADWRMLIKNYIDAHNLALER